jgi:hypothetical protein
VCLLERQPTQGCSSLADTIGRCSPASLFPMECTLHRFDRNPPTHYAHNHRRSIRLKCNPGHHHNCRRVPRSHPLHTPLTGNWGCKRKRPHCRHTALHLNRMCHQQPTSNRPMIWRGRRRGKCSPRCPDRMANTLQPQDSECHPRGARISRHHMLLRCSQEHRRCRSHKSPHTRRHHTRALSSWMRGRNSHPGSRPGHRRRESHRQLDSTASAPKRDRRSYRMIGGSSRPWCSTHRR